MHGDAGLIRLGRDDVSLDELAEVLRGACKGKVIYFGSCLTLKQESKKLKSLAAVTGARAIVGYRRPVAWLDSAAFEVLLLDRLVRGVRSDAVFNRLTKEHGLFAKSLGLVVATRSQVYRVSLRDSRSNRAAAGSS